MNKVLKSCDPRFTVSICLASELLIQSNQTYFWWRTLASLIEGLNGVVAFTVIG